MITLVSSKPSAIKAPPAAWADRPAIHGHWAAEREEARATWLDTLTEDEADNLEWYGHPCGDIHGIDGPAAPCTC
ncbi:hypothetical protein ACIHFD_49810 [Nonomuraea sp. NPDC051941]|uniref:hypothetical protein n=1 Tax=Nonomuraea sp. NPDC051941 TaxID=3364373 RepID=UPI0037C99C98